MTEQLYLSHLEGNFEVSTLGGKGAVHQERRWTAYIFLVGNAVRRFLSLGQISKAL